MDLTFCWRGLIIGLAIAAPVGAIGLLCIRRTLADGRRAGFVSGLGAASANALYGAIAALGLASISSALVAQQGLVRLVGGLVLSYLGVRTVTARPPVEGTAGSGSGRRLCLDLRADADQPEHDPVVRGGLRRARARGDGRGPMVGGAAGAGCLSRLGAVVAAAERRRRALPAVSDARAAALGQPALGRFAGCSPSSDRAAEASARCAGVTPRSSRDAGYWSASLARRARLRSTPQR